MTFAPLMEDLCDNAERTIQKTAYPVARALHASASKRRTYASTSARHCPRPARKPETRLHLDTSPSRSPSGPKSASPGVLHSGTIDPEQSRKPRATRTPTPGPPRPPGSQHLRRCRSPRCPATPSPEQLLPVANITIALDMFQGMFCHGLLRLDASQYWSARGRRHTLLQSCPSMAESYSPQVFGTGQNRLLRKEPVRISACTCEQTGKSASP